MPETIPRGESLRDEVPETNPSGDSLPSEVPETIPSGDSLRDEVPETIPSGDSLRDEVPETIPSGESLLDGVHADSDDVSSFAMPRRARGHIDIVLVLPDSVPALVVRLDTIAYLMAKNVALFPSPPLPIATFRAHIDDLKTAQAAVRSRTAGTAAIRDKPLLQATNDAHDLRGYVNRLARANPEKAAAYATASGMVLRQFGGRKAGWLSCEMIAGGVVQVKAPVLRNAVSYEWAYRPSSSETWIALETTAKARNTIPGLQAATTIHVRVRAVTRKGMTNWSVPFPFIVGSSKRGRKR